MFVLAVSIQAAETDDNTENDKPETLNVAKNFRRALLDALEQLEMDEKTGLKNDEQEDLDASDYEEIGRTKYGNKVRSNNSKQESTVTTFSDGNKASVFVHSFTHPINDESSKVPSISSKTDIEATTIKLYSKPTTDNFISDTASSFTAGGSSKPATTQPSRELTAPAMPKITPTPKTPLTSPTPTVTTPVEEEDESKSKAEDVQFISAPLVAAFTVEQDDKGLPRKVIPIYGNKQSQSTLQIQNSAQDLQATLEAKQRQLEQQLRILQEQKRQHELLLQRQAIQKEQLSQNAANQNFQFDQNINLNVQNDLSLHQPQDIRQRQTTSDQNRINIPIPTQKDVSTLRPTKEVSGTVVAFQPSIVFQPNLIRNELNQKPATTFNNRFPQNINTQFTQVATPNSVPQFNQLHNTATRFNQVSNQNPQTHFNSQNTIHQAQFNSQPVRQQTHFTSQSSVPQFSQGITINPAPQFGQFTQSFTPSIDQSLNQFNSGLPQRSPSQFNQGFITPSIELSHTIPQPRAPTQFNTGFSTLPVNQFNTGFSQVQSPFNHQQFNQNQALPIKSAVDFQKAINVPIPDTQNFLAQQQIPNQVRDNSFINNDQYLQDFFYRQRTLVPPPPRTNRVNRHEAQIGNFGINDFNSNNNFPQRFSPSNYNNQGFNEQRNNVFNSRQPQTNQGFNNHLTQNNADYRLKNLIYQSGLGQGRGQEDLNIVSKVLSLDHTGNYQKNFLFGESNVSERRIPFRQINKTFNT